MKSAFECFQRAAKCEDIARATSDRSDRAMLLATAQHWRDLAKSTRLLAWCEITARPPLDRIALNLGGFFGQHVPRTLWHAAFRVGGPPFGPIGLPVELRRGIQ